MIISCPFAKVHGELEMISKKEVYYYFNTRSYSLLWSFQERKMCVQSPLIMISFSYLNKKRIILSAGWLCDSRNWRKRRTKRDFHIYLRLRPILLGSLIFCAIWITKRRWMYHRSYILSETPARIFIMHDCGHFAALYVRQQIYRDSLFHRYIYISIGSHTCTAAYIATFQKFKRGANDLRNKRVLRSIKSERAWEFKV